MWFWFEVFRYTRPTCVCLCMHTHLLLTRGDTSSDMYRLLPLARLGNILFLSNNTHHGTLHRHTNTCRFTHNTHGGSVPRWLAFNNLAVVSVEWPVVMDTTPIDSSHKAETSLCLWWVDVLMLVSIILWGVRRSELSVLVLLFMKQVYYSASNILFHRVKQITHSLFVGCGVI